MGFLFWSKTFLSMSLWKWYCKLKIDEFIYNFWQKTMGKISDARNHRLIVQATLADKMYTVFPFGIYRSTWTIFKSQSYLHHETLKYKAKPVLF